MRLQRYLSMAGAASRRGAEALILAGRVSVDGKAVRHMGVTVDEQASVMLDGRRLELPSLLSMLVVHKPVGMITSLLDPQGRPTVAQLIPQGIRLYPVGRLDYDTAGVLLLTNDGAATHVLTHPRYGVEKQYQAVVRGRLASGALQALRSGIELEDGWTQPAQVRILAEKRGVTIVELTIHEGRNRQIRRMFEFFGYEVCSLVRLRFGPVSLGSLRPGESRELTRREEQAIGRIVLAVREEERNAAHATIARAGDSRSNDGFSERCSGDSHRDPGASGGNY